MAYTALTFVADELLTSTKMNLMAANDASFADGTGIQSGAITSSKLSTDLTNASKTFMLDFSTTGVKTATGCGFTPKSIFFFGSSESASTQAMGMQGWYSTDAGMKSSTYATNGSNSESRFYTDRISQIYIKASSAATYARLDVVSLDVDGFTYDVTNSNSNMRMLAVAQYR